MERQQTKVEKEVFDRISYLYDRVWKEKDRALAFRDDRSFVRKQYKLIDYCDSIEDLDGLSDKQKKLIKALRSDVARLFIAL